MTGVQAHSEVRALPLLRALLAVVRRRQDTPLQFDTGPSEDLRDALRKGLIAFPHTEATPDLEPEVTVRNLDGLLGRLVAGAPLPPPAADVWSGAGDAEPLLPALAAWTEHTAEVCGATHPLAAAFLELRAEGLDDRAAADRLGLGLRLVRRLAADLGRAWAGTTGGGPSPC